MAPNSTTNDGTVWTIQVSSFLDRLVEQWDIAKVKTESDPRWHRALVTAYDWLLQQDTIQFDLSGDALLVPSATNPEVTYVSNGVCQCAAFAKHQACWHRAASKLVRNALYERVTPVLDLAAERQALAAELFDPMSDDAFTAQDTADDLAAGLLDDLLTYARDWDVMSDAARHAA